MKASQFFIATLKEAPADAEIVSHKLMMRAGMIKKVGAGIYTYMPMGLRVIRKVERIIREEMDAAGAVELAMPMVQPAELWQETGRWDKMGPELLRLKDRHERDFALQPTSEEVVTDIARSEIRSYKQLPVNFYQIQVKFRDERRPRFGLMRGREFTMKDAYSFDRDVDGMRRSYQTMFDAYTRIFERFGLAFRAVAADNGAIGGSGSHEFHVIADTGEDAIAYSEHSGYAANLEAAEALPVGAERGAPAETLARVATPGTTRCEDVATLLGVPLSRVLKSLVVAVEGEDGAPPTLAMLVLRGDHELNEVKANKLAGLDGLRMATEAEITAAFGCPPGYLGPVVAAGRAPVRVIADRSAVRLADFICGANEAGQHLRGVNWGRDLPEPEVADLRQVVEGDPAPDGSGPLKLCRGIEVGHVFMLGTRYSAAMQATFLDEAGKVQPMVMGCYGIGVTRILGAAIEQGHDARGIIWPQAIAPFELVICPVGYDRSDAVREKADALHAAFAAAGVDVMLDDRGERPGAMFADWELIGVPHRVVVGDRGLKEGKIEYQGRRDAEATTVAVDELVQTVLAKLRMSA